MALLGVKMTPNVRLKLKREIGKQKVSIKTVAGIGLIPLKAF